MVWGGSCGQYTMRRQQLEVWGGVMWAVQWQVGATVTCLLSSCPPSSHPALLSLPQERSCSKSYMARVLGRFPTSIPVARATPLFPAADSTIGAFGPACASAHREPAGELPSPPVAAANAAPLPGGSGGGEEEPPSGLAGVALTEEGWLRVDMPLAWEGRTNHASVAPPGERLLYLGSACLAQPFLQVPS